MSVQYSPKLNLPYDPEDTLAALRVMQAEDKNTARLQREFALAEAKGKVVKRATVVKCIAELITAFEEVVGDYPDAYYILQPRVNAIINKYGYTAQTPK